jgi:hypothetical protein
MLSCAYLTLVLALLPLALSGPLESRSATHVDVTLDPRAPVASTKNVIIQMFEWTWDSVAAECTNFIGPAGYGFVQGKTLFGGCVEARRYSCYFLVSPPQEHIAGAQWWTDYQPVSYILTSKRGNRAQFQR